VRLHGEPRLLSDADEQEAQRHVGQVLGRGAVLAHAHVGLVCEAVVAGGVVEVAHVLVAHLKHVLAARAGRPCSVTHPDALLDHVVLIRLELVLQLVLLRLDLLRLLRRPRRVSQRSGVLGGDLGEVLDQVEVQLHVAAAPGLCDCGPVCVDGEVRRVRANVAEAVGAREAIVVGDVRLEVELGGIWLRERRLAYTGR
jgi:hypothetical protein